MKGLNLSSRSVFLGVLFCLMILSFFYFRQTIFAAPAPPPLPIPKEFGELKTISMSATGIFMLWFEDKQGTIRVVFFDKDSGTTVLWTTIDRK